VRLFYYYITRLELFARAFAPTTETVSALVFLLLAQLDQAVYQPFLRIEGIVYWAAALF
jgi:hypothetical protein